MTVSMLLEGPTEVSQTHTSIRVGRVEVCSIIPVRLPPLEEVEVPRAHLWVGSRGIRRPVKVTVSIEADGSFLVEDPISGIFGDGPKLSTAVEDFRAALVSHRDELRSADRLSGHMEDQLRYLNDLLE